jgi:hypothetical protein
MTWSRCRRSWTIGAAAGLLFMLVLPQTPALASSPLVWSAPQTVDPQATYYGPDGVSCPAASLCVLVDGSGNVVTSTNPTGGMGAWTTVNVDGSNDIEDVSCPSAVFCVAVDSAGKVITSTNPTGGASAWTVADIDKAIPFDTVSCASASFCLAGDLYGNVLISTNPTGGAAAWSGFNLEGAEEINHAIGDASCAAATLCMVSDNSGEILASHNPSGGPGAWFLRNLYGVEPVACPSATLCLGANGREILDSPDPTSETYNWNYREVAGVGADISLSMSCPSVTLCVVTTYEGRVMASTNPTGDAEAWSASTIDDAELWAVSCTPTPLCVAVDEPSGRILVGTASGEQPQEEGGSGGGAGGGGGGSGGGTLPNTVLGSHPPAKLATKSAKAKVKFKFSSSTPGTTFKCKLDKGAFKPCQSPKTYKVKPGKHVFTVEAIDSAGADATPASYRFKVVRRG